MARRKSKRRRPDPVETFAYTDSEGNVLVLRGALTPGTIRKLERPDKRPGASAEDAYQRRTELLFERLAVSWEISGLPLDDQKLLLGRYRMADADTRRWVAQTIATHVQRHLPELAE